MTDNSNADLMLDVGQANEYKLACRRAGYTNADVKKMCEGDFLAQVLPVIRGQAKVEMIKYLIDCSTVPFISQGWSVEFHDTALGQFELDISKIELYLSKHQKSGAIQGNKLRKELKSKKVLNANVLDYLLDHPELIPEEWKGKYIFFWGTIYRDADGYLFVRYLRWSGDGWRWSYRWLVDGWDALYPSAVLASN